jgi:hypothetical protein
LRKNKPAKKRFTQSTYRKALPFLLKDFEGRCAYSLVHFNDCGTRDMEIDHHNPTVSGNARHNYENLFPATRHCNGKKSDEWPTRAMQKKGIRFLNPCKEQDYDSQIFEKEDGRLVGTTPAARWHIMMLDLNASHLIHRRNERRKLKILLRDLGITLRQGVSEHEVSKHIAVLQETLRIAIPFISPPPLEGSNVAALDSALVKLA